MRKAYQPRYSKGGRIGGRYLVHQALLGGMGEVYLCLDEETFLPRALKTFQGSDLRMKALFESEVANWIALEKYPHIVRLFHLSTLDNIPFMLLEWIASDEGKGTDLRSWLRRGALPLEVALKFTIDIVRGLQHANEKSPGIVHRDLKPDNVLVNQSRQAKITDFGLATVIQQADLNIESGDIGEVQLGQSMRVGHVVGTPAYMPPEQWRGELDLDFRTDIYAAGCILYELLTGSMPFRGRTISELRTQHIEAPWPDLTADFPAELKPILSGCLAKERAARYETLDLLFGDLKRVFEQQSSESLADIEVQEFTAVDYNNRGFTYSSLGQHQRAIQDYDEAIRLDLKDAEAYSNRGNSYGSLGQYQRAIEDYDEAIRLDPTLAQAYVNRGNRYGDLGQPQRAIEDYDEAIRLDPTLAQAYSSRGASYGDLGQHQRAIQDYDEAIRLDPNNAVAYSNRGGSYGDLEQHKRAIEDYDEAIRLDPTLAQAYSSRGASYGDLGQHQRAIQDYDEAIRLDPNNAVAYSNRGGSYGDLEQHKRAIEDYDEAIRLDPNLAPAYSNRGKSYGSLRQHERAIQDFDEAIRLDPTLAPAYAMRGYSYGSLRQHERAIQDFDEAIRLDPNVASVYYNRGNRYGSLGQYRRAIQDFDEAIRLDPNDAQTYAKRGYSYGSLGQYERAIQDYDEAIRLDPTLAVVCYDRGRSYVSLGQHERAIQDFNEAIRLDPNDAQTYYNRGASYVSLGQHERAIQDYDEAIYLDPNFASAYFNKGVVFANTGRLQESLSLFEKAYSLGLQQAADVIHRVRQDLGQASAQPQTNPNDPQAAFNAFQCTNSFETMQQTIQQYPVLAKMIPTIQQVINEQIPSEAKPAFEQRLAWLKQLVEGAQLSANEKNRH